MRRCVIALMVSVALVGAYLSASVHACPGCTGYGSTTLAQEASSAGLIVFGTLKNARLDPKDINQGTTEIDIETVIKPHEALAGRKTLTIKRYIPIEPEKPSKYLVLFDVYKGELDSYRGTSCKPDSNMVKYMQGVLARKDKPVGERLQFCFDYLNDEDQEIAQDAYTEFGFADYKDFRPVAEKLPAAKIAEWLNDPGASPSRLGLYGSMLGHCGKPEHVDLLKRLMHDPQRKFVPGVEGILFGLTILDHKEGWKVISDIMADGHQEFLARYAALRAARYLWEYRPDVVDRDKIAQTVVQLVDDNQVSDMAIEDLRKWHSWKAAAKIVKVLDTPVNDTPIIRRAVLRYALQCPPGEGPAAAAFVKAERAKNAEHVKDVEAFLNLESTPVTTPATPPAAAKGSK